MLSLTPCFHGVNKSYGGMTIAIHSPQSHVFHDRNTLMNNFIYYHIHVVVVMLMWMINVAMW